MAAKRGSKQRKVSQNSETKRKFNPKSLANLQPFKPGQSGNPGGRPKLLGESYKAMLAKVNENDPLGRTNAEIIADALKLEAFKGDVGAAREIRSATEGDKLTLATWQTELVDALKAGKLTAEDVISELGREQGIPILVAAGQTVPEGAPSQPAEASSDSTQGA